MSAAASNLPRGTPVLVGDQRRPGVIARMVGDTAFEVVYGSTGPSETVEATRLMQTELPEAERQRWSTILSNFDNARALRILPAAGTTGSATGASQKTQLKRAASPCKGSRRISLRQKGMPAENASDEKALARADRTDATDSDDGEGGGTDRGTAVKEARHRYGESKEGCQVNGAASGEQQTSPALTQEQLRAWEQALNQRHEDQERCERAFHQCHEDQEQRERALHQRHDDFIKREKELDRKEAAVNAKVRSIRDMRRSSGQEGGQDLQNGDTRVRDLQQKLDGVD